ncbi:MAG TPA: APC family permease, partial [Chlamydiales bacterium]|nr:APC family permease [Chlamydiales bacterium]
MIFNKDLMIEDDLNNLFPHIRKHLYLIQRQKRGLLMESNKKSIRLFTLAMINVAAICNIANLPLAAKYGTTIIFFYLLATLFFFVPVALVSAELATGWPQRGGVYIWVREGLGPKMGFVAIWLQWIENVIWYPTVLSFLGATFAYIFNPTLALNKFYIMSVVIIVFWSITFVNFLGMQISGWISTICSMIGQILPGTLIIILAFFWIIKGHPVHLNFSIEDFLPNLKSSNQLSLLAAILLSLAGLEMSAAHAKEVKNPQKSYPKAILFSAIIILTIMILGALSIAIVTPSDQIQLASGSIQAFQSFFKAFDLNWALPILALLISIGSLGQVSTWTVGPTKGLLATANHGELPPFLQKVNKKNMPVTILSMQAITVTLLSAVFLFMPSVTSSYQLLLTLAAQLY